MKKIILASMAAVMMATSAMAMSPAVGADGIYTVEAVADGIATWDNFWGDGLTTAVTELGSTLDPANSGWDLFWGTQLPTTVADIGTALDPKLNGWDDFWYQCQDPNKTAGDCVGTVAAGVGLGMIVPFAAMGVALTGAIVVAGAIPMTATGMVPSYILSPLVGTGLIISL